MVSILLDYETAETILALCMAVASIAGLWVETRKHHAEIEVRIRVLELQVHELARGRDDDEGEE